MKKFIEHMLLIAFTLETQLCVYVIGFSSFFLEIWLRPQTVENNAKMPLLWSFSSLTALRVTSFKQFFVNPKHDHYLYTKLIRLHMQIYATCLGPGSTNIALLQKGIETGNR